jgi:DNA mismatch repair protein MutS
MSETLVKIDDVNITPMMKQYLEAKAANQDCLLLFRMGDFYELFFDDAITAAQILEIALTKRGKQEDQNIPMCGVPYPSVENYINKLIKHGFKVAICEQLETPEEAKKRGYKAVVKREVIRIITPGTLTEDNLLEGKVSNFLASIVYQGQEVAISYIDLSTCEFYTTNSSFSMLPNDLARINPSEIIITDDIFGNKQLAEQLIEWKPKFVTFISSFFDYKKNHNKLKDNFGLHDIESLGRFTHSQVAACGSLIEYLCITQRKNKITLNFPKVLGTNEHMIIDNTASKNLELFHSENNSYSLLKIIDKTISNAGGRLFRKYLAQPLNNTNKINSRLSLVEFFTTNQSLRDNIREKLKLMPDLERATARITIGRGEPRDLYAIKQGLDIAIAIANILDKQNIPFLKSLSSKLLQNDALMLLLSSALIDQEIYINKSDFIAPSFDHRLATLYNLRDNSVQLVTNLRDEYRQQTNIPNLKLEFNNMLGYYIEITPSHMSKITSEEFILRQSMVNAKRFTTSKLRNLENEITNAKSQISIIESEIFSEITNQIASNLENLSSTATAVAYIDVIISLATLAVENKYTKPIIDDSDDFYIENGRHPVVEQAIKQKNKLDFIANDCNLNPGQKLWLITGPNMAGKSTFLRQNTIIAILAQMGSFVPADKAKIGIIDRVFCRVGAGDDLAQGRSTFLVEMIETATILNQATNKSLIILDEIGRGTSTYDGMAIAWSCLEYIHNNLKSRALFATHFHELTELSKTLSSLKCYSVQVKEWENKIIFMHKVIPGIANKSYGINVAELAGLPPTVINRAKHILESLHKQEYNLQDLPISHSPSRTSNIEVEIRELNLDELTPKTALDYLYNLKKKLSNF